MLRLEAGGLSAEEIAEALRLHLSYSPADLFICDWAAAVLLGESGNVLMMPGRARDQGQWMTDARMLVDAGSAAYRAARAKDLNALTALEAPINASCVSCHKQYRPNVHPRS